MYDNNSFTAIDRLVDFAKSTAIQEQMTRSMNETIDTMRIPGAGNPMPKAPEKTAEETKGVEHEN